MFKNQCYSNSAFGIVGFHSAVVVKPGILADTGAALFKDLSAVLLCRVGLVGVSCPLVLPRAQFVSLNRCLGIHNSQLAVEEETKCWTGKH